jgi:hypothetical protein
VFATTPCVASDVQKTKKKFCLGVIIRSPRGRKKNYSQARIKRRDVTLGGKISTSLTWRVKFYNPV